VGWIGRKLKLEGALVFIEWVGGIFFRKKKKPEGYPTGETLLYKPINASEFVQSSDHIELLANTSEVSFLCTYVKVYSESWGNC
jgi:hypothetical protein